MRRALIIAGALFAVLPGAAAAAAACPPITEAQALARADVVFEGIAQPGPAASNGILATPARFRVTLFVKGTGPDVISVAGGPRTKATGLISLPSAGVGVKAGQAWVVYARGEPAGIVETSSCYGTHLASRPGAFATEAPSPTPTPIATEPATEPGGPSESWPAWAAVAVGGLGLLMGTGWGVARKVVGTR